MRIRSRWAGYAALAMIVLAVLSSYMSYASTIYRADRAIAWLSRAETAGFAEEMIADIQEAKELIPGSGNPVWWFPTQRTDFALIQSDMDSIIARAQIIQTLPRDSTAYQQGMDDLRGKLRTLEEQVGDAAPFMFASPLSLALSAVWMIVLTALIVVYFRGDKPTRIEVE